MAINRQSVLDRLREHSATAQANPPPRIQTREAVLAEAHRLSAIGLDETGIRAAMERAGWAFEE